MDYGQKGQPSDEPQFFTAGVGDIPADQNLYGAEDNLDLTNETISWAPDRDARSLGNKAIFSTKESAPQDGVISSEQLHEMVDLAPPPGFPTSNLDSSDVAPAPTAISFNPKLIRTDGDRISRTAILEVNNVISKLSQTGNAADFYASVRGDADHPGMVRSNLKNSYNREVA